MYHDLIVDGTSLKGYKVYINGKEAYNSAERDVEMIEIPGRDGAFSLDHGRFKNITVSYDSGTFADNQTDFADNISDLRNFLASKRGYVRIEDDYNPDEYRMGVFQRGLEFDPVHYNMASEFPIEFNCKPQRFLKSGEAPVSVASGDTITNPTLFDAHPLIKFNAGGNGTINIGDDVITVLNAEVGNVDLSLSKTNVDTTTDRLTINNSSAYLTGDPITLRGVSLNVRYTSSSLSPRTITPSNVDGLNASGNGGGSSFDLDLNATDTVFTAGTSATVTKSVDVTVTSRVYPSSEDVQTKTFSVTIAYNGTSRIDISWSVRSYTNYTTRGISKYSGYSATADSSKPTVSGDIYIDLDIGEAYGIDAGSVVSLNNFINLGGELPVLPPGSTTISYSANISNVQITPRWWRV